MEILDAVGVDAKRDERTDEHSEKQGFRVVTYRLTFVEPLLGTASANPDIHRDYIASKSEDAEKIEEEVARIGVDAAVEKGMTIFPKLEDGTPFIYDYQVKGFFKESCYFMRQVPGSKSAKVTYYKKKIDGLIYVTPRCIPLRLPEGKEMGKLERPLRAQTAQGERVALANSEMAPVGSTIQFNVTMLTPSQHMAALEEWLTYGRLHGMGQWRNASFGRFEWERVKA